MTRNRPPLMVTLTLLLLLGAGMGLRAQTVLTNIPYATVGAYTLHLDLYLPAPTGQEVPCVLWIHGGGWWSGSKASAAPDAPTLVAQGWAVAALNYRLSGQWQWPAQLHDCKGAVRWLRANAQAYGIDASRIAAFGHSAGGHLAAMLGTTGDEASLEGTTGGNLGHSSRVCGVVDFSGPTDLIQLPASAHAPGTRESTLVGTPIAMILANQNDPAMQSALSLLSSTNPANYVSQDDPPFYVAHGDADGIVPPIQSRFLVEVLDGYQIPTEYRTVPGAGHSLPLSEYDARLGFLRQVLSSTADQNGGTLYAPAGIQMGTPAVISVSNVQAGDLVDVWVSDSRGYQAASATVAGDLLIRLDRGFVLWSAAADGSGAAASTLVVPQLPQLEGLNFYLQALVTPAYPGSNASWSTMIPTRIGS